MPTFTNQLVLGNSAAEVFAYLRVPQNRLNLVPPEWPLELADGPALFDVGVQTTWKVRRFGLSQTLILETTICEPPTRLVEVQRTGPFGSWAQAATLTAHADGVLLHDRIDFEPPGGMLGFMLTPAKIAEMLEYSFAWRDRHLPLRLKGVTA